MNLLKNLGPQKTKKKCATEDRDEREESILFEVN